MIDHNNFLSYLTNEIHELEFLEATLLDNLSTAPDGSLNVLHRPAGKMYYWNHGHNDRKYLNRNHLAIARALVKKECDSRLLAKVQERLALNRQLRMAYNHPLEEVFLAIQSGPKGELYEDQFSDKVFLKNWFASHPGNQNSIPMPGLYFTDSGLEVRSKSEIILAELFQKYDIPFVYEPILQLGPDKITSPDFLLLNLRLRKTYVFEHFGLMNDPGYQNRVCTKFNLYQQNNYFPGENLLFTIETKEVPLNTRTVEHLIKHYLL